MNQQQTDSLIRSVLKVAGAVLVAHGATKAASVVNCEDMFGLIVGLVGVVQSYRHHASPSETTSATADLNGIIRQFAAGPEPVEGAGPEPVEGAGPEPVEGAGPEPEPTNPALLTSCATKTTDVRPSNPPIQQSNNPVFPAPIPHSEAPALLASCATKTARALVTSCATSPGFAPRATAEVNALASPVPVAHEVTSAGSPNHPAIQQSINPAPPTP
jgi:hypothetical protein